MLLLLIFGFLKKWAYSQIQTQSTEEKDIFVVGGTAI